MDKSHNALISGILDARRTGTLLDGHEASWGLRNLEDGYSVQEAVVRQWGDEVAGWKVGATSRETQKLFGISEPIYGPVFRTSVFHARARVPVKSFPHRILEAELAFRFPEGLPMRSEGYSRNEVVAAADALVPAFETISPRFSAIAVRNVPLLVADFCLNGGAVLGAPCTNWRAIDLPSCTANLIVDGVVIQRGSGELVLGNPLNVLEWFVSALAQRGKSIAPGQFVMTGTITGLHAIEVGQTARSDFGTLGAVEITFA